MRRPAAGTSPPDEPGIPIGAVVNHIRHVFPDVTASSLRFLERQGLVVPHRTVGGHRVYSTAAVERIIQIKRWQAQHLSLREIASRLRSAQAEHDIDIDALAAAFASSIIGGEAARARRLLLEADRDGVPLSWILEHVITSAMTDVGRLWQAGEVQVAQEKECSEVVRDVIADLVNRHRPPEPTGPVVVAACVEGERHELGLRTVAGLLQTVGYTIHYLGVDVDPRFIAESIRLRRPDAVLLSAKLEIHFAAMLETIRTIRALAEAGLSPAIIVGGDAVAKHIDALQAEAVHVVSGVALEDIPSMIGAWLGVGEAASLPV